jgi:hypothetical protein
MRVVLAIGLLITVCVPASATALHSFQPHEGRLRPFERASTPPARFAVPGWTNAETRQWLHNGSFSLA